MSPTEKRVALVTGAGRRVGNTIAHMLAGRGFSLAVHYHHSQAAARGTVAAIEANGRAAAAFQADVADEEQVERMFAAVMARFGRLDVLVTSAAIWEPKRLEAVTAEDLRRHFEVNTLGTFLCARRGGLLMAAQPSGGAIVTLGDWATARPYPDYAAYFPSKGAIPALTRDLAVELSGRNRNVRVNCILPGPVMLPQDLSDQEREAVIAGTLLRREGRAENVGQAVLFLVENDYVTGVCLPVDGGRTIAGGEGDRRTPPE